MWLPWDGAELCRRVFFLLLAGLVRLLAALYEALRLALGRGAPPERAADAAG